MSAHLIRLLDRNGDGVVSLADLETAAAETYEQLEAVWHIAEEQFKGAWCKAGVGALMLFYGGHFKATAIIAFSLRRSTIAVFKAQIAEVMEEYSRVRGQMEVRFATPADETQSGPREVREEALHMALASAESRPLIGGLQRLSSTVLAQVAMALNHSTMTFGVGIQLSRRIADLVSRRTEQMMLGDATVASEAEQRQVRMMVETFCAALGLASAWLLKGWAALWNTCQQGAQLCVDALAVSMELDSADMSPERVALMTTSLGVVGLFYQAQYWGKPYVPWALQPILLPLQGCEKIITSLV